MVVGENLNKLFQLAGAALGVPAAAVGTIAAYQSYFSSDETCQKLRSNILATMERSVTPETKRSLLKKDVTDFDRLCGAGDPDARALFHAALDDPAHLAPPDATPAILLLPPPHRRSRSARRSRRSAYLALRAPRSITVGSR